MPAPKLTLKTVGNVLTTGATLAIPFITTYLGVNDPTAQFVILSGGLSAVGAISGNLSANYLQTEVLDKTPKDELLKNGDLTRAIGKTVFAVCRKYAKESADAEDKKNLLELSDNDLGLWEDLILGGSYQDGTGLHFNDIDTIQIESSKIIQYAKTEGGNFDEIKALDNKTWHEIIQTLANKKGIDLSQITIKGVADKLHHEFAEHLHTILVAEATNGGKAFASFQYRILGDIFRYTEENNELLDENIKLSKMNLRVAMQLLKEFREFKKDLPNDTQSKPQEFWEEKFEQFSSLASDVKETKENTKTLLEKQGEDREILEEIRENTKHKPFVQKEKLEGLVNFNREATPYFVEQGDIFNNLDKHFNHKQIANLCGFHGLGKSTTAIKYAEKRQGKYDFVLYVLATTETLETNLAGLADEYLGVEVNGLELSQKAEAFKKHLEKQENGLIVFDNLETIEEYDKYFPLKGTCKILYTSNETLFRGIDPKVELNKFSSIEAERFVYMRVNAKTQAKHVDISEQELAKIIQLIDEMGFLPNALNIAGALINEEYLEDSKDFDAYDRYINDLN